MTPGADGETADGMSTGRIDRIIDALRHERYRFSPVRRVHIPKKNGMKRALGLPSWSDKIVGEVVRLLLTVYYEPRFSDRSHGFRSGRGCHTALSDVAKTWTGTTWFIEGDIAPCFDTLDHEVMLGILGERIHDNRFLRLLRNMLKAGYLEDWRWNATLSGAPQGSGVSPVTANARPETPPLRTDHRLRARVRAEHPPRPLRTGRRCEPRNRLTAAFTELTLAIYRPPETAPPRPASAQCNSARPLPQRGSHAEVPLSGDPGPGPHRPRPGSLDDQMEARAQRPRDHLRGPSHPDHHQLTHHQPPRPIHR
ncbi:RNA-directed DNA polymerase [Parafrankia sp. EUN1f]|nr:RNA-directed DNA polymerase [Parafrankia sp. EUN1f]